MIVGSGVCRSVSSGSKRQSQHGFIVGLLLIALVVVSAVIGLLTTTSGAILALRAGIELTGSGYARGVQGSILSGLRIAELRYSNPSIGLEADDLQLRIDWRRLRERQVRIDLASAQRLHVELPGGAEDDDVAQNKPLEQPSWPELPVEIVVQQLRVGSFTLAREGEPVPVQLESVDVALHAHSNEAQLNVDQLVVHAPDAQAAITGSMKLKGGPIIGVDAALHFDLQQHQHRADIQLLAQGTVEHVLLSLSGSGEGLDIDAHAALTPFSDGLPLRHISARVHGLDPSAWLPDVPPAQLNFQLMLELAGGLNHHEQGESGTLALFEQLEADGRLTFDPGSHWQNQPLVGKAAFRFANMRLPSVDVDLGVGKNRLQAQGAAGALDDTLHFDLKVPQPSGVWPGLEGNYDLKGILRGMPERHSLSLTARVALPMLEGKSAPQKVKPAGPAKAGASKPQASEDTDDGGAVDLPAALRQGPINIELSLEGGYHPLDAAKKVVAHWTGRLSRLQVNNPAVTLQLNTPVDLRVQPPAAPEPLQWSVGPTVVQLTLPAKRRIMVQHVGSSGSGSTWRSAGRIDELVPAWLVAQLPRSSNPLRLAISWDLAAEPALAGSVHVTRRGGDLSIPGATPLALGLRQLELQLQARGAAGDRSNISVRALIEGERVGRLAAQGSTVAVMRNGVPEVTEQQPVELEVNVAVNDLGWISMIIGDETEVGGQVHATARFTRANGEWSATGTVAGDELRVVRIDDGIRLLDGTLRGHFTDERLVVDTLRFPGVIRTTPRSSQVRAWIAEFGDKGFIEASGSWSLAEASGSAEVQLERFPLVQRADRFIAGSGQIQVEVTPRRMQISGRVKADAGWISVEGVEDLPSLASDVVIMQGGQMPANDESLPLRLNLDIDLGQNVYLTGMGLSTALEGQLRIRNTRSGLRANGTVNTRGGAFSIYGQTLVVDHGIVTFQGPLDDPLLDIVAVRKGLQVEAGVQISGTARAPVITLVSFPDVPDVEKLSWLLLGRGPAASGADAGMLLSAAASLLRDSDNEPLSRQLGLDELGLRSGAALGGRGILPEQTVIGDIKNLTDSAGANQFLVIGKRLTDAIYLTFEQALSGRETIVRASYRISERLSASLRLGTINGLDLVWSFVFDD